MNTPDTEWEKLVKLNRTCDCTLGWCTECLKWKGVIELALTSRDTYWKERVGEIRLLIAKYAKAEDMAVARLVNEINTLCK